jgi:hypothetical protein
VREGAVHAPSSASSAGQPPGAARRDAEDAAAAAATADAARSQAARAALDRALAQVLAGDRAGAVETLRAVKAQAAGRPDAREAERGIDAIQTAADLERLADPGSVLAQTLRRTKRDELRGTRWARLFAG